MAVVHDPGYMLRPEGGHPGMVLKGITYQQALEKAAQLAQQLRRRVYVDGIHTIASCDPRP